MDAIFTKPLPEYEEWRKMNPDDAAQALAISRNLSADEQGFIAALLEIIQPTGKAPPTRRISNKRNQ